VALATCALVAACGDGTNDAGRSVRVFAAASLTDALTEIAEDFESRNEGVEVELNFAASSELVAQILEGAPADVFASADEANMRKLLDAGAVPGEPVVFARNELAIAVEHGNPLAIAGLSDLADPGLRVALCAEEVPCGTYAQAALDAAGVSLSPLTRGESVKATLSLVALGEADAAIVYVTDIAASREVDGVTIPEGENVATTLPIAALDDSATAQAFVTYTTSPAARRVLIDDFGFLAP